jgi:5-methylcytosine-specific restriction endonuclease McrA
MRREVLLLNQNEEVIKVIDWKRAVHLIEKGKAKAPLGYKKNYKIRTSAEEYILPAALVLVRYVCLPWPDLAPTRRNIFKRDKWTCQYCGKKSKDLKRLTVDHIHPKCKGGGWQWTNLTTACPACNLKKGNMTPKECGMIPKKKPHKPSIYALQMVGLNDAGKELWSRWIDIHIM